MGQPACLRSALERDYRQMPLAVIELDLERESIAGLPSDERTRHCTWCTPRPALAWFDARASIGRSQSEVHFVGCLPFERHMGAMLVVPSDEGTNLAAKRVSSLRDQNPTSALILHGLDEAFNHGDAPMLSSRAVARADSLAAAPLLEARAPENRVLVTDQVLRCRAGAYNRPAKEGTHSNRLGSRWRNCEAHCTPRVVVDDRVLRLQTSATVFNRRS